jgi:GWxTD domain-containing protein
MAVSGTVCVDPARDLRALAQEHVIPLRDDTRGTDRMVAGFAAYLESGSRTDQLTAVTRYTALGTGRYTRRDLVLGIIYASSPDLTPQRTYGYRNRRLLLYSNTEDQAMRHLERALQLHPDEWLAGVAMARVALGIRSRQRLAQAREHLTVLLRRDAGNTAVRLALADILIARDSAATARALLEPSKDVCAAAAHAYGEALILSGDTLSGAQHYGAALRGADGNLDRFVEDVILALPYDDREVLERLAPEERRDWLVEWWDRSAARSARTVEERIAAHLRRVAYAQQHYRKAHNPILPPGNLSDRLLVAVAPPWDARGEVLIRHGEPDTVIATQSGILIHLPQNESWLYARGEPQWLFNFVWREGADWSLASPYIGCGGSGGKPLEARWNGRTGPRPTPAFTVPGTPDGAIFARDYYADRAPFDEFSAAFMRHCEKVWGGGRDVNVHNQIRASQEAYDTLLVRALRSESARHALKRPVRLRVNAYAFRTAGGTRESAAVLWIPKADLGGMPTGRALVQVALVGDAGAPIRRDTIIEFSQLQVQQEPVLATQMSWQGELPRGARLYAFAADVVDAQRGAYVDTDLPAHDAASASISSVVVAAPAAAGPLVRGSTRVWPHAGHAVLVGETFRLFYEIYGLTADEPIRTRVTVQHTDAERARSLLDLFRGKRADRIIEFAGVAAHDERGISVHDLEIGGDLVPGSYSITIEVRTARETLTRTGAMVVRDPAESR